MLYKKYIEWKSADSSGWSDRARPVYSDLSESEKPMRARFLPDKVATIHIERLVLWR